jgi:uncharacterized protein YegL
MNNNLVELVCICDRSGSMDNILDDAIGGFDSFIDEQRNLEKDIKITLITFDGKVEEKVSDINIKNFKSLKNYDYVPRGNTALYDAIGFTINSVGNRLNKLKEEERPGKIIVVIQTDGQENYSKEFKFNDVKTMIEHQTDKYKWEFLFLGAGLKEEVYAFSKGIGINNSLSYSATGQGVRGVYTESASMVNSIINGED